MNKTKHWLHPLEKIYLSKTTDLRDLAYIAGEDPIYFYIGTPLKGADLRGQDLRGMNIQDYQIEGAITDKYTKFDWSTADEADELTDNRDTDCVIFVPYNSPNYLQEKYLEARHINAKIYNSEKTDDLSTIPDSVAVPKFVIIEYRKNISFSELYHKYGSRVVFIVVRRGNFSFLNDREYSEAISVPGNVIFLPISAPSIGTISPSSLSNAIGDLIALLCYNWAEIEKNDSLPTLSVFFRSRGSGLDKGADALCRILSSVERSKLTAYPAYSVFNGNAIEINASYKIASLLFSRLEITPLKIPATVDDRIDAALFIDPSRPVRNPKEAYTQSVIDFLGELGWHLSEYDDIERSSYRWTVKNSQDNLYLNFPEIKDSPSSEKYVSEIEMNNINFDDISEISISENINDSRALVDLLEKKRLWACARDFINVDPTNVGIWGIISQQVLRLGKSANSSARTQYFRLIFLYALRISNETSSEKNYMSKLLNSPNFSNNYEIKCSKFISGYSKVKFLVRVISRDYEMPDHYDYKVNFEFLINANGPHFIRFPRLPE